MHGSADRSPPSSVKGEHGEEHSNQFPIKGESRKKKVKVGILDPVSCCSGFRVKDQEICHFLV